MGTILCSAIIDKAEIILKDTSNRKWAAADLFGWLKSGQREAAILKPDISVSNAAAVLVAGTKQSISSTGIQLIRVVRNMGTGGTTPGAAIPFIEMDVLDAMDPDWHTATASATVKHWTWIEDDPKNFYVYPPQPTSGFGYVEKIEAITPADPAATSNVITLDDIYETVLLDYILYRAFSEDSAHSLYGGQRALAHWNAFVMALGRKDLREKLSSPKSFTPPGQQQALPVGS